MLCFSVKVKVEFNDLVFPKCPYDFLNKAGNLVCFGDYQPSETPCTAVDRHLVAASAGYTSALPARASIPRAALSSGRNVV